MPPPTTAYPSILDNIQRFLVALAAIAWPWGAYQKFYGLIGIFEVSVALLCFVMLIGWVKNGRPRIPFDIFWPAIIVAMATYLTYGMSETTFVTAVAVLVFLVAVDSCHGKREIFSDLFLGAAASGVVGVITFLAGMNWVFPTAMDFTRDIVAAGPVDVTAGLCMFLFYSGLSAALLVSKGFGVFRRLILLLTLPLNAFALIWTGRGWITGLSAWAPPFQLYAFPGIVLFVSAVYLAARCMARIYVLQSKDSLFQAIVLVLMALLALLFPLFSIRPSFGVVFCLGMLVSLSIPKVNSEKKKQGAVLAPLLMVPVVAAHAYFLFPGDARNYLEHVAVLEKSERAGDSTRYLEYVTQRYPGESRARLAFAEHLATSGEFEYAADEFSRAVSDMRKTSLMGRPSTVEISSFLAELNDMMMLVPPKLRGVAYERSLAAMGRTGEAIELLAKRAESAEAVDGDVRVLREALSEVLGNTALYDYLDKFSAGQCVKLLSQAGSDCEILRAPEGFPRELLPLILLTRSDGSTRWTTCRLPNGVTGASWRETCAESGVDCLSVWLSPELVEDGEWIISLGSCVEVAITNGGGVKVSTNATKMCPMSGGGWSVLCVLP